MFRAACRGHGGWGQVERKQASNLQGRVSRQGGWDKALSCPEGH